MVSSTSGGRAAFFAVAVLLLPYAFLGLDFTDTAYHFLNQKLAFQDPAGFLRNSCHYWLSDVLVTPALWLAPYVCTTRVLGVLVWAATAAVAYRLARRFLRDADAPDEALLVWCTVPAMLLSAKPFATGTQFLADYNTIPAFAVALMLAYADRCARHRVTANRRDAAVAVALLAALPLLRWTLCLPGLATLAWILYRGLGWSRLRIAGALVLNVFALGLYQTYFLERFVPVLSGHHDPGLLVSLYLLNIQALLVVFGPLVLLGAGACALWRFLPLGRGPKLLLLGLSAWGSLVLFLWLMDLDPFGFAPPETFLLGILATVALAFRRPKEGAGAAFMISPLFLLFLLYFGTFFLGSNTGFVKSGYLAFLVLTPFLYSVAIRLPATRARAAFVAGVNVAAVVYLYASLFRDDIGAILRQPVLVRDEVVGLAVTHGVNRDILADFRRLVAETSPAPGRAFAGPEAPLLHAYLPGQELALIWADLEPEELLSAAIRDRGKDQWLFLAKRRFDHAERFERPPKPGTTLAQVWTKECGWDVRRETEYFLALRCR